MGRSKGIVEVHLEAQETDDVATKILCHIPTLLHGMTRVDPTKMFGKFATNSILKHTCLLWYPWMIAVFFSSRECSWWFAVNLGKSLSKDTTISDYIWILQPLAELVPSQPIHQDSLFEIVKKLVDATTAEGICWLLVYDLKTLMQYLDSKNIHFIFST